MLMKNYKGIHNKVEPLVRTLPILKTKKLPEHFFPKPSLSKQGRKLLDQIEALPNREARDFVFYTGVKGMKALRKTMFKIIYADKRKATLLKNRKNRWSKETREKYAAIKQVEWEEKQKELILKDEV